MKNVSRSRKFGKRKNYEKRIALERIKILEEMKKIKPEYSDLYDKLIERIKKRYKI